jgi:MurNAc alpha-1-phosphate uridylyltransferase
VVNGDIWCDWDFRRAYALADRQAHLVFVDNPPQHAGGDFCLDGQTVRYASDRTGPTLTYAGTGIFSPAFFADVSPGAVMKMRPLLDAAIARRMVTGERHAGRWVDVGTPERLAELDLELQRQS